MSEQGSLGTKETKPQMFLKAQYLNQCWPNEQTLHNTVGVDQIDENELLEWNDGEFSY